MKIKNIIPYETVKGLYAISTKKKHKNKVKNKKVANK